MASWNREQAATQRLLSHNFQEPRWKTAALKNAYALLGRRRFGKHIPIAYNFLGGMVTNVSQSMLRRSFCWQATCVMQPTSV